MRERDTLTTALAAASVPVRDINERLFSSFAVDGEFDELDEEDCYRALVIEQGLSAEERDAREAGHVW